ncbi:MAG: hypothetical protein FWG33_04470 [Oscillospiraceae bacterium]|nr:hypothetical protein [Oscillospiraceae bacterium]
MLDKKSKKTLHGNSARIDPKKKVSPLFENSVTNGYKGVGVYGSNAFARAYNRLDFDEDLGIQEVDSNPLS